MIDVTRPYARAALIGLGLLLPVSAVAGPLTGKVVGRTNRTHMTHTEGAEPPQAMPLLRPYFVHQQGGDDYVISPNPPNLTGMAQPNLYRVPRADAFKWSTREGFLLDSALDPQRKRRQPIEAWMDVRHIEEMLDNPGKRVPPSFRESIEATRAARLKHVAYPVTRRHSYDGRPYYQVLVPVPIHADTLQQLAEGEGEIPIRPDAPLDTLFQLDLAAVIDCTSRGGGPRATAQALRKFVRLLDAESVKHLRLGLVCYSTAGRPPVMWKLDDPASILRTLDDELEMVRVTDDRPGNPLDGVNALFTQDFGWRAGAKQFILVAVGTPAQTATADEMLDATRIGRKAHAADRMILTWQTAEMSIVRAQKLRQVTRPLTVESGGQEFVAYTGTQHAGTIVRMMRTFTSAHHIQATAVHREKGSADTVVLDLNSVKQLGKVARTRIADHIKTFQDGQTSGIIVFRAYMLGEQNHAVPSIYLHQSELSRLVNTLRAVSGGGSAADYGRVLRDLCGFVVGQEAAGSADGAQQCMEQVRFGYPIFDVLTVPRPGPRENARLTRVAAQLETWSLAASTRKAVADGSGWLWMPVDVLDPEGCTSCQP